VYNFIAHPFGGWYSLSMKRGENLRKHGLSGTPEHRAWCGMMGRCYSTKEGDRNFALYQGAGIIVVPRWHEFINFLADMGNKPSSNHSLDRYPDASGDYEPGNCRWATAREQANNWKDRNRKFQFNGRNLTLSDWARELDITRESLRDRLRCGWSLERAFTTMGIRNRRRNTKGQFVDA
jgi:hypothetical protein